MKVWTLEKGLCSSMPYLISPGLRYDAEHDGLIIPSHFSPLVCCFYHTYRSSMKGSSFFFYLQKLRLPRDERQGCHPQEQTESIVWEPLPNFHWSSRNLPSLLGFPRTFLTSALVGFVPRARRTSPTWLKVILLSPVLSNRRNASLNSARSTIRSGPGGYWPFIFWNLLINPRSFKGSVQTLLCFYNFFQPLKLSPPIKQSPANPFGVSVGNCFKAASLVLSHVITNVELILIMEIGAPSGSDSYFFHLCRKREPLKIFWCLEKA